MTDGKPGTQHEDVNKALVRIELTVPALNRLLGGDSELEVHLREQVIEQFCKSKLAPMLTTDVVKKMFDDLRTEVIKRAEDQIGKMKYSWQNTPMELTAQFKMQLDKKVQEVVDDTLRKFNFEEIAQKAMVSRVDYWKKYIDDRFQAFLDKEVAARIKAGVEGIFAASSVLTKKD